MLARVTAFGEVQYYFKVTLQLGTPKRGFAMVANYSPPDAGMLAESYGTLWSCRYMGTVGLKVIDIKTIASVVAMVPHPHVSDSILQGKIEGHVYMGEKIGLDLMLLADHVDEPGEGDNQPTPS